MKKLIIPRGVVPRRYRKLVASGEVKGEYHEIDESKPVLVDLVDFMDKQDKVQNDFDQVKPKLTVWKQGAGNV